MSDQVRMEAITISEEESAVLDALILFDSFNYPLKPSEVHQFVAIEMSPINVLPCLNYLANHGIVHQHNTYFSLNSDASIVAEREAAIDRAARKIRSAHRFASIVERFPFVRCVGITGNLSRGLYLPNDSIELFIIAQEGHMWVTRFLLDGFIRFFHALGKETFTIAKYIDTGQMQLSAGNMEEAIALRSLIPTFNKELFIAFLNVNEWSSQLLPMYKSNVQELQLNSTHYPLKRTLELVMGGKFGSLLSSSCMRAAQKKQDEEPSLGGVITSHEHLDTQARRDELIQRFNLQVKV